jgi:subtilase family serine protease
MERWQKFGKDRARQRPSCLHAPEALESRQAFSVSPAALPGADFEPAWLGSATSTAQRGATLPMAAPGPTGFTPAQIRHAYGLDAVSFGGTPADGRGTTIAIVTAYDSPNIAADLATFNATFGIPAPPSFQKVNQTGGKTLPAFNASWSTETCLDVQ